jgi:hypothetical protein
LEGYGLYCCTKCGNKHRGRRQKSWLKTVSSCPKAMPIQRKVYKSQ